MSMTRYEKAVRQARNGYGATTEAEVKRVARQLFAKDVVNHATIGRNYEGKLVVHKTKIVRRLPS
jgi:alkylation response protein AidB-like acyl-CoA dehydrogenase